MSDTTSPLKTMNSGVEEEIVKPAWGAIFALTFGVIVLTAAQTLPVSLLTPMAADLHISEGLAGQTMTATSAAAFVTSLVIAFAARSLDRRVLLLLLAILQIASNLLVVAAPNPVLLLLARMLLGIALGGTWSFCAAVAMRLAPTPLVPRALSIIFGGGTIASIAAVPLGSVLGSVIGWRGVFLGVAALGLVALAWQFVALPSMPSRGRTRLATMMHVLWRPQIRIGMLGVLLLFAGRFAYFTYLRPFLESVTGVDVRALSLVQLGFGVASIVGTALAGAMLTHNLRLTLILLPLFMCALAVGLMTFGSHTLVTAGLVALWGFAFSVVPIGWTTWITRTVPEDAESGGGLFVATTQLAITLGAAVGGVAIDSSGAVGAIVVSAILLLLSLPATILAFRERKALPKVQTVSGEAA
ncbi:MAG: MFS transporter [Anaerolineales bacterium]|nr:MFS transporter [Anaerolineales bacterium]